MPDLRPLNSISELSPGDTIRHIDGGADHVVTSVHANKAIATPVVEVSNPSEWLHLLPAGPSAQEAPPGERCSYCNGKIGTQWCEHVPQPPAPEAPPEPQGREGEADWLAMEFAPRDGSVIRAWSLEGECEVEVQWSTHYSIHGLGGCWQPSDGFGQYGDIHLRGWRPAAALNRKEGEPDREPAAWSYTGDPYHHGAITPHREVARIWRKESRRYGRPMYFVPPRDPKVSEDEFHVLRLLGNGQITASKARELIAAVRDGLEPELMPYEVDGGTPLPNAAARQQESAERWEPLDTPYRGTWRIAPHVVTKGRRGGGRDEPLHYYLCGPRRETEDEALSDLARWESLEGRQEGEHPEPPRRDEERIIASFIQRLADCPEEEEEEHANAVLETAGITGVYVATEKTIRNLLECALEEEREARQVVAPRQEASGGDSRLRDVAERARDYLRRPPHEKGADRDKAVADALDEALARSPADRCAKPIGLAHCHRKVGHPPGCCADRDRADALDAAPPVAAPPGEGVGPGHADEPPFRVVLEDGWARIKAWNGERVGGFEDESEAQESAALLNRLFPARPFAAPPPAMSEERRAWEGEPEFPESPPGIPPVDLSPCPKCGGAARWVRQLIHVPPDSAGQRIAWVACSRCGENAPTGAEWNKRAAAPPALPVEPLSEEVRESIALLVREYVKNDGQFIACVTPPSRANAKRPDALALYHAWDTVASLVEAKAEAEGGEVRDAD